MENAVIIMNRLNLFLLTFTCLFNAFNLKSQSTGWIWRNPLPQGAEPMYDIHMADAQTIFAAGRDGYFMRSPDGGQTWSVRKAAGSTLTALDFTDTQTGWACGGQGTVVKTTDGGNTWTTQAVPGSFDFNDVDFVDAQNGWLAGPGVILKTSNGGNSWQNVSPNTFFSAGGIHFINSQEGWFCGTIGSIMHTTDGGTTWTSQTSNTNNELRDIKFFNNLSGWACGVSGTIVKTSDGGNTWNTQNSGASLMYLNAITITDSQTAFIGGQDGTLLKTVNGGSSWSSVYPFQLYQDFWGITFAGNKLMFTQAPPQSFPGTGRLGFSSDAGLTWQLFTRSLAQSRCDFRDVIMRTAQEWWAMGNSSDSGYVMKTSDAGLTWSKKTFNRGINAGALRNASLGWISGANNQIFKTTDGGNSWVSQAPSNVSADYYDIQVLNDQTLWVAGYNDSDEGVVIKSTDGGQTWMNVQSIANEAINSIFFIDDQKGWAVGNGGVIRKTSDGGQSWSADTIEFESGSLKSVFFTSAAVGYIVGASGHSYKTTDGGQNWYTAGLGGFKGLDYHRIQFIHPDTGFAVRSDGKIFKTVDAAASWTETAIMPAREIYAIDMLSSGLGIAGGNQAAILTSESAMNTSVTVSVSEDELIFPNPAGETIYLKSGRKIVKAWASGPDGRQFPVEVLPDNKLDVSRLPTGLYYLQIQTEKERIGKKFLKD